MKTIIQYTTTYNTSLSTLDSKVNEFISTGWQPYKSPYVLDLTFYQALVKYEETT